MLGDQDLDRQEEGPWLDNGGWEFPKWPVSSLPSCLRQKPDSLKQNPCLLLAPTSRSLLVQQVQGQLRTCYRHHTVVNQLTILSLFKLTIPKLGGGKFSSDFKNPSPHEETGFSALQSTLFLRVCCTCVSSLPVNNFFQLRILPQCLRFLCCCLLSLRCFLTSNSLTDRVNQITTP